MHFQGKISVSPRQTLPRQPLPFEVQNMLPHLKVRNCYYTHCRTTCSNSPLQPLSDSTPTQTVLGTAVPTPPDAAMAKLCL